MVSFNVEIIVRGNTVCKLLLFVSIGLRPQTRFLDRKPVRPPMLVRTSRDVFSPNLSCPGVSFRRDRSKTLYPRTARRNRPMKKCDVARDVVFTLPDSRLNILISFPSLTHPRTPVQCPAFQLGLGGDMFFKKKFF